MDEKEYIKLVNKNTLLYWNIISVFFLVFSILEIYIKSTRIVYSLLFIVFNFLFLLIAHIFNKNNNGENNNLKYLFSISHIIFYTFILSTNGYIVAFLYIVPMIPILISYCDKKLIIGIFSYILLINIIYVYLFYYLKLNFLKIVLFSNIIMFGFRIICLILLGIFIYRIVIILKIKEDVIDELKDNINKDALTGLKNIRFLENNINKRFNFQNNENLSIAFIDIDNFKRFNTLYGHKFGDQVLKMLSKIIIEQIDGHKSISAIRVGGDEFVIISTSINNEIFIELLDSIRKNIEKAKIKYENEDVGVCISVGISDKTKDNDSCSSFLELYNLADFRNEIAKENGKNIIVTFNN